MTCLRKRSDAQATSIGLPRESKGWIGEWDDPETGLTYLNARYYDPVLARFISPDWYHPKSSGVGTNRYAYALNNPGGRIGPGSRGYSGGWFGGGNRGARTDPLDGTDSGTEDVKDKERKVLSAGRGAKQEQERRGKIRSGPGKWIRDWMEDMVDDIGNGGGSW